MSDRIAVVGGSGFVGCHLVRALRRRGSSVVVFDRVRPDREGEYILGEARADVEFVDGDIIAAADVERLFHRGPFGGVVNLAAVQELDWCDRHPSATYRVNVEGALRVFEAAHHARVPRVLHASSTGALVAVGGERANEDHPTLDVREGHPAGHYGASKAMSEIAALAFARVQRLDLLVLRFPSVYGFGSPHQTLLAGAVGAVAAGRPFNAVVGGDSRRDYLYVRDAAEALLRALDAPSHRLDQRLFFIALGRLHTDREVAEILNQLAPASTVSIGPGLSEGEAAVESIRATYEISAAERQLGFRPAYDLRRGLHDYLDWTRAYLASQVGAGGGGP